MQAGSLASLRQELNHLVAALVPQFSDGACIDCFLPDGITQRFAMYADDQLIVASNSVESFKYQEDERSANMTLSDGFDFLGALRIKRSPSSPPLSDDERLTSNCLPTASRSESRTVSRRFAVPADGRRTIKMGLILPAIAQQTINASSNYAASWLMNFAIR